ncbi:type IX secretion system periplasmic lipoprotein PorW/SprE [Phaeocystidibacter marisrubri]|uniref:Tetratricopeptide repeat protein n=1 Tax=Phaeocystidibacter marisrubri TaxID=1577780 RepID=A0A6L3ZGD7_9FLAO|nr:tetratricopeptide repeat protein [Phaeocystidibacter marisrubri]KAB2816522.1 tetratricopeptide repeat protein [Phaeocystidibacter marisrubri]
MRIYKVSFVVLIAGLVFSSCSRTKDNFFSRTYHQMTSKFNPLFNGEQAYLQGYTTLKTGHVNNYDDIIELYPFGSAEQAQSVVPQMDRAIEKAVKVIREHSMNIGGKQKNPYVIDAYLLMAKAYFMKQDYFKGLEAFNYIMQKFPESEQAIEARLWAGRANTRIESEYGARKEFEELYRDRDVSDRLKPHVYASFAELEIKYNNYEEAINLLNEALDADPDREDRVRWRYALGQLYERMKFRQEASDAFEKVVRDHPADYEFYLNAQLMRALNYDVDLGNVMAVYDDLEDMAKDDKNTEYRDRIYYIMALLALEDQDYMKAEESLKKSVRLSEGNNEQRGLSYAKLAEINFDFRAYVPAQAYYDTAFSTLPRTHSLFPKVERFRSSLSDLVNQINTIETNDSLIRLAGMSITQQRAIFEEYIANLKEREEAAAERERNLALNRALAQESAAMGTGPTAGLGTGTWYFYNETTRSSGVGEFTSFWGRRELTDNWRQAAKASSAIQVASNEGEGEESEGNPDDEVKSGTPTGEQKYNIDAYLAQVPKSEESIEALHLENQDAYIRLASIYQQEIEDEQEAVNTFRKLLERYPETKHAPMAMYALYLIHKGRGEMDKADGYASQLRNKYPNSEFTAQLEGKLTERDALTVEASEAYKGTYETYVERNYRKAKQLATDGLAKYAQTTIGPKFGLLLALTTAQTDGQEAYANELRKVVASFSGTVEAERAQELLMFVDESSQPVGNVPDSPYKVDPKTPHKVIIVFPNSGVDVNALRNKVSDFNRDFNRLQNLQTQTMFLDRERQILVVSGFKELSEAHQYAQNIVGNPQIKTVYSSEIMRIFAIGDANYQTFYRLKDVDEYMTFYEQITTR